MKRITKNLPAFHDEKTGIEGDARLRGGKERIA